MTDDFKVEPWRDGELSLKVANVRLILPYAQARAIGQALLEAAGGESEKTCATCKFCDNCLIQASLFGARNNPDSFGCIHWQPAPARKDGEGES